MARLDFGHVQTEGSLSLLWGGDSVIWTFGVTSSDAASSFEIDDYSSLLLSMLPVGDAWPAFRESGLAGLTRAVSIEPARLDAVAQRLVAEADPASTADLLSDWERLVGMPDTCVTTEQTTAERRMALTSRITAVGSQSRAFFVQLALRLGYEVTIDEFTSAGAATAAGISFTGDGWAHIWRVNVPVTTGVRHFAVGSSVGEPLQSWGDEALECQFNRFKPAHTTIVFAYAT